MSLGFLLVTLFRVHSFTPLSFLLSLGAIATGWDTLGRKGYCFLWAGGKGGLILGELDVSQ